MKIRGPESAPVVIIVEHPTVIDYVHSSVLEDASGVLLTESVLKAGFKSNEVCYVYLTYTKFPRDTVPKDWTYDLEERTALQGFLDSHPRSIICGCGELVLNTFLGHKAITKWRGSMQYLGDGSGIRFIPTIAPHKALRKYEYRFLIEQDLRRVYTWHTDKSLEPSDESHYILSPTFSQASAFLQDLLSHLDERPTDVGVDIETRWGHITCIAFSYDSQRSGGTILPLDCCIPFTTWNIPSGYYAEADEFEVVRYIRLILGHPNIQIAGQNFPYDTQYIVRHWGVVPNLKYDTMTYWHTMFAGLPKSLAFICSMMLPWYTYWKEEGKGHCPMNDAEELTYWRYNIRDARRTLDLVPYLVDCASNMHQTDQCLEQMDFIKPFLTMMLRGVKQDVKKKNQFMLDCMDIQAQFEGWFQQWTEALIGDLVLVKSKTAKPWYRSPKQQSKLFYEIFKIKPVINRKTGKPTCDDDALPIIGKREPILRPICNKLIEYRSLCVFLSTFVLMSLDHDKRVRCSYGVGMTETFRCTSSGDAFGFGGNLQNIPTGNKI